MLGGNYIPRDELRRRARAEAEIDRARRKAQGGPSGRRLGGSSLAGGLRDAIASATLSRNNAIVDNNCGTGTKAGDRAAQDALLNGFRSKQEMDKADELAIQKALYELMQVEEGRKLDQEAAGGNGQYYPGSQGPLPPTAGPSWDQQPVNLQPVGGFYAPGPASWTPPAQQQPPPTSITGTPVSYPSKPVSLAPEPELDRHGRPLSRLVKDASKKRTGKASSSSSNANRSQSRSQAAADASQGNSTNSSRWDCLRCTLINEANATECNACGAPHQSATAAGTPAPSNKKLSKAQAPVTMGWNCLNCGTFMEHKWWMCSLCGMIKTTS
jgi:rubrerythrin